MSIRCYGVFLRNSLFRSVSFGTQQMNQRIHNHNWFLYFQIVNFGVFCGASYSLVKNPPPPGSDYWMNPPYINVYRRKFVLPLGSPPL